MSKAERKGNGSPQEPPRGRWRHRLQRIRNEAGLCLVRGAATAAGGAVVAYGAVWVQTR